MINIKKSSESSLVVPASTAKLPASSTTADKTSSEMTLTQSQVERFLIGKKLALCGFTEQVEQDLNEWVNEAGGEIPYMDFDGVLDYLVLPPEGLTTSQKASQQAKANRKAKEIVSRYPNPKTIINIPYHTLQEAMENFVFPENL